MVRRRDFLMGIFLILTILFYIGFSKACSVQPLCGNNVLELGEGCDYGSLNGFLCWAGYGSSCDYCTSTCKLKTITNYCGDGILNSACEECDDGNIIDGDGCSSQCQIEEPEFYCGDGVCSGDETCFSCSQDCGACPPEPPVCGNGILEEGEQCDDGNSANGDGCSSTCMIEQLPENETEEPPTPPSKTHTLHMTKIDWEQLCEPNWQCNGWSECNEDGFMTRQCYDKSNCLFSYNKPAQISGCELQKVLVEEETGINNILLWVLTSITALLLLILLVLLLKR